VCEDQIEAKGKPRQAHLLAIRRKVLAERMFEVPVEGVLIVVLKEGVL
jgi:hypothetical protein